MRGCYAGLAGLGSSYMVDLQRGLETFRVTWPAESPELAAQQAAAGFPGSTVLAVRSSSGAELWSQPSPAVDATGAVEWQGGAPQVFAAPAQPDTGAESDTAAAAPVVQADAAPALQLAGFELPRPLLLAGAVWLALKLLK